MTDRREHSVTTAMTADVQVPFKYAIIHGGDPSRRSAVQKARTRSLSLMGLVFETTVMTADGFHLSFTESSYGRNSLEIRLDLGKKIGEVEIFGQVEWYERRATAAGHCFIVGVGFVDLPADSQALLRDYLKQCQLLKR